MAPAYPTHVLEGCQKRLRESVNQAYLDNRVADLLIRQRHDPTVKQGPVVAPGLDSLQMSPSNMPRDNDEVIEVKILEIVLSHGHV